MQPSLVDRASAAPRWMPAAAVGAAGLAACAMVAVRDPNASGSYGICPFLALTGQDCPGCGMLRASHALFTGDLARATDHNVLWPLVLALIVVAYLRWAAGSLGYPFRPLVLPTWAPYAAGAAGVAFWVIRNLGGPFEYLAAAA